MGKYAEDAKKHMTKNNAGVANDMKSVIKMLNGFYPNMPAFTSTDEIMDLEFTFVLKLKSPLQHNHEL